MRTWASDPWLSDRKQELDATPLGDRPQGNVIACLNVWNDRAALEQTVPSWLPFVDAVVAVDGSYGAGGASTDGTVEYLAALGKPVHYLNAAGMDQCSKRSLYLGAGLPGDVLFIVDADETVENGEALRELPQCDVGWVRVRSKLYNRPYRQPRLIRWMPGLEYRGRHHWIYQGDRLVCTHQYGGVGYEHRPVGVSLHNQRRLGRSAERVLAEVDVRSAQVVREMTACSMPAALMSDSAIGARESLRIATVAYRDDGMAPSRLHTAINRTTPHTSLMLQRVPGPFGVPRGHLWSSPVMAQALKTADVIHYHVSTALDARARKDAPIVLHFHGTKYRNNAAKCNALAKSTGALVLLSNLELFTYADGLPAHFLPNAMPVARYLRLREQHFVPWDGARLFRIAHSPSQPHRKGTEQLLAVCARLAARGVPVEPVLLHDLTHAEVLAMKATCHAAFDSFWLGMQCSGLEAAAMLLPVIAGDATVRDRYVEAIGECPYTFADNEEELEYRITQLIDSAVFYDVERRRVHRYVRDHHDEAAVALRYLDLLDGAFGWRKKHTPEAVRRQMRRVPSPWGR